MRPVHKSAYTLVLIMLYLLCPGREVLAQNCTPSITISGSTALCKDAQVILSAPESASYLWSNGATTRSITVQAAGSYTVTTVAANGCKGISAPVQVTSSDRAGTTLSPYDPICTESGKILLSGGQPVGGTYSGPGVSDGFFDPKTAGPGTHTITYTVPGSELCSNTATQQIQVNRAPDASIKDPVYDFTYCSYSGSANSFKLEVENTSTTKATNTAYTINWGDGKTNTYGKDFEQASHVYTSAGLFTITVTATDADGCVGTSTEQMFIGSNPGLIMGSDGNNIDCAPVSYGFRITGVENNSPHTVYTFQFDDGTAPYVFKHNELPREGNSIVLRHEFLESSKNKPNGFTLTGTATNKCNVSIATFTGIRISKGPVADFAIGNVCVGEPVKFQDKTKNGYDASARNDRYRVKWEIFPATGWTYTSGNDATLLPNVRFNTAGEYRVRLTASPLDQNSTCAPSVKEQVIIVNDIPKAEFELLPDGGVCAPTIFRAQNQSTGNDLRYTWLVSSQDGWSFAEGTNASSANPVFSFTKSGTYTVSLVASSVCSATSRKETTIKVVHKPVTTLPAAKTYCGLQTISFSESDKNHLPVYDAQAGQISSYRWEVSGPGATEFTNGTTSSSAYPTIKFSEAGQYEVRVIAVNECGESEAARQLITIDAIPEVVVTSPKAAICLGESTTLSVTGADTYTWSPATGLSATTGSSVTASPKVTTTYTVTGKNSDTGCTATTTFTVVVNTPPTVSVSADVAEICVGQGTATLIASGADSYTWSPAVGLSATSGASVTATPTETTTYTVTGTDAATGCTSTATVTVKINPLPEVKAGEDITICNRPTPTKLQGFPAGGTWSGPHVSADGTFTAAGTGTFELTYTFTNASGCINSDKMLVTVNEPPVVNAGEDRTVCLNSGTFKLQGLPAGGKWSGSTHVSADGTFNPAAAGTFTLTYTYGTGNCETTGQVNVTVNSLPTAPTAQAVPTICPGSGTTLRVQNPQGTIAWYDKATGGTLLHTGAEFPTPALDKTTTYYVQTTIAGGCTSTRTAVKVNVYPATPAPVVAPVTLCGDGSTATLVAEGNAGGYEWFTDAAATQRVANTKSFTTGALPVGVTTFYVHAVTNGCYSPIVAAQVTILPALANNTLKEVALICAGQTPATITGSEPEGGNKSYTYRWESSATSATSGFELISGATGKDYKPGVLSRTTWYRRTVLSAGCSNTSTAVEVTVTPVLDNNTITGIAPMCEGSEAATLTGSKPTGGTGSYTYTWESSTSGASGSFTAATGNNREQHYTPGVPNQTTWFRRKVTSGACAETVSAAIEVKVIKPITENTISVEQATICSGTTPAVITGRSAVGGTDEKTYRWEMRTENGTYGPATDTNNGLNYTPRVNDKTMWYRRVVTGGPCGESISNEVQITVQPAIVQNTIAVKGKQVICQGQSAAELSGAQPAGGNGSYTYRWLYNTTGPNATFTPAPGNNTGQHYTSPTALTQTTWYLREVVSGECISNSTVVELTVVELPVAPTVAPVTICEGSKATLTVNSTSTNTFRWYTSATAAQHLFEGYSFETAPLTETTTYYVEAVNVNGCGSSERRAVTVTVNKNIANNTLTVATAPICAGQRPSTISGSEPTGGGGAGTYTYRWESSETGPDAGFSPIAGATAASYQPNALQKTTWFRRVVTSGPCAAHTSAAVKVEVLPAISNNLISVEKATLCSGDVLGTIKGTQPAGGSGASSYTYLWESSRDGVNFSAAAGTNTQADYTAPAPVTQRTWFRRIVTSAPCTQSVSEVLEIVVQPVITNNTITTKEQTICSGEAPAQLVAARPAGGNENPVYLWESKTEGSGRDFEPAAGVNNGINYQPGKLTQNTWFRRKVVAGECYNLSEAVRVVVNQPIANNTISQDQVICTGSAPAKLTGTTPTGGDGSYTYYWEAAGTDGVFRRVNNSNIAELTVGVLTTTTSYRRVVTSGPCSQVSNTVTITVSPAITGNTVGLKQNIWAGQTPAPLTGSTPAGGAGPNTYTYVWESSTRKDSGYQPATGLNSNRNYSPQALQESTWFRRRVISGGCESISEPVLIDVLTGVTNNNIRTDQVICAGNKPATLKGSLPEGGDGGFLYLWLSSTKGPKTDFVTAAGNSNGQDYSPAALTQSTWFRRVVVSGPNPDTSAAVLITVKPPMANNKMSTSQTICYGTAPSTITGTLPTGGSGSYTYLWESSTSGPDKGFMTATGTNNRQDYSPAALTQTTWFRRVVTSESCDRLVSEPVVMTVTPLPATPVASGVTTCHGSNATLMATGKGGRLEWYTSPTGGNPIKVGDSFTTPALTSTTTYYVQEVALSCASERRAVTVTVTPPSANAGLDVTTMKGRTVQLQAGGGETYSWSPAKGLSDPNIANPLANPEETTTYTVTVTTAAGCVSTAKVTVTVQQLVYVPNTFTPNLDGINDTWEIPNIEQYPNCKVQVFNQWGNLIFSSIGYKMPWDGRHNGKELPLATYYYVIQLDAKEKPLSGSVTIVK